MKTGTLAALLGLLTLGNTFYVAGHAPLALQSESGVALLIGFSGAITPWLFGLPLALLIVAFNLLRKKPNGFLRAWVIVVAFVYPISLFLTHLNAPA